MNESGRKLLIVDDEPTIADGLQMLFREREELGLEVKAAYSSKEALGVFAEFGPDVVLLDIQIPGVTGLELAGRMRALHPAVKIIFLTGYDYFEYAYKAIKQDATDYILKTEGDDKVIAAVAAALDRIAYEQGLQNQYTEAQARLATLLPVFRDHLLAALLNESSPDAGAMFRAMAELDESLTPAQPVLVLLGRSCTDQLPLPVRGLVQLTVEQILRAQLHPSPWQIFSASHREDILWFLAGRDSGPGLPAVPVPLLEDIQTILAERAGCKFSFVLAREQVNWMEIGRVYRSLQRTLALFDLCSQEGIAMEGERYPESSLAEEEECADILRLLPRVELLKTHLQNGNLKSFRSLLDELCRVLSGVRGGYTLHAIELYLTAGKALLGHLNETRLYSALPGDIDLALLYTPTRMQGWPERAGYLEKLGRALCEAADAERRFNAEATICRIKDYIGQHLASDLSLNALGRATGFNPSYLSRIFKRDVGIGLHDYITRRRMELARSLLTHTKMKIYEVAQKCGYDNTNYFIRIFKLTVGLTPQEYRNRHA
ncbi:MAG: response regulator [Paenibacillus macerans]|nr:response regulator [Paenibacillus macerans]KFN08537.1 response regulator [Paenibacillus macerans]MCY7559151.1 response regulator [Paenibacillus macerans]MDU7474957.1 response regulator [Paenibacillus macerans]MEC0135724.1 response regulator [Paenibacillus macerans]MEC0149317.1 response regulator [Paenibacillus macerans]